MSERETAQIVVCAPAILPRLFTDDLFGVCALCQTRVIFRPHIPARRVLVCLACFYKHAGPHPRCQVLDQAVAELQAIGIDV